MSIEAPAGRPAAAPPTATQLAATRPGGSQPAGTEFDISELRQVFATGRTRSLQWRLTQIEAIERMCNERETEIAAALQEDLGRTPVGSWLGDIVSTTAEATYARKHLKQWMRRHRVHLPLKQMPASSWVQYDPLGVVMIIGPWNYPFYLSLAPLVAAVAAGNCVVLKPSELAPACSALIARLVPLYLDPEAVRVVEGDGQTTQDLLAQGFDHVLFTGGTAIGAKIMAAAAPTLTPVTLELGGKSPVIVAADADLDIAARRIAWVKLMNSGQTCIAPDYVLVERTVAKELTERIVASMKAFRADESDPGMQIVNARQFERLAGVIESTTGSVVTGGVVDRSKLTITPTVIVDPSPDDAVMTEEIFGPVLPVLTIESTAAAVEFINRRPKPLALYIFGASKQRAKRLIDQIPSGGAVINHIAMHCLVPQLPFGGVGGSGMGAYHGRWGFETFSHRRAVLWKTAKPDIKLVYPPYTPRAERIMRKLF